MKLVCEGNFKFKKYSMKRYLLIKFFDFFGNYYVFSYIEEVLVVFFINLFEMYIFLYNVEVWGFCFNYK